MGKKKRKLPRKGSIVRDCWSLNVAFAEWVIPRLRWLAKNSHGYPCSFKDAKAWSNLLTEIADGISELTRQEYWYDKHDSKKLAKALDLFTKHLGGMWD